MSKDKVVPTSLQRCVLNIVRREMRTYDLLSQTPRLRYERSVVHSVDALVDIQQTRRCAHDRALVDPCPECERNEDDCVVYRRAVQSRIKELLKTLGE